MKITITVNTQAQIKPSGVLKPTDLYNIATSVAGNSFTMTVDDSDTVQQLADATDALMSVDPALTVQEKLMDNGLVLPLTSTLAEAGVTDGSVIKYSYVINA